MLIVFEAVFLRFGVAGGITVYLVHHMSRNGNWKNVLHFSRCSPAPPENSAGRPGSEVSEPRWEGTSHVSSLEHACGSSEGPGTGPASGLRLVTLDQLLLSVPCICPESGAPYFVLLTEFIVTLIYLFSPPLPPPSSHHRHHQRHLLKAPLGCQLHEGGAPPHSRALRSPLVNFP